MAGRFVVGVRDEAGGDVATGTVATGTVARGARGCGDGDRGAGRLRGARSDIPGSTRNADSWLVQAAPKTGKIAVQKNIVFLCFFSNKHPVSRDGGT